MSQKQAKGKWEQFLDRVQVRLGKLTHDNLDVFAAKREQAYGKIEDHYEILREQADKQIAASQIRNTWKELS